MVNRNSAVLVEGNFEDLANELSAWFDKLFKLEGDSLRVDIQLPAQLDSKIKISTLSTLFHDTAFGQLIRVLSRHRYLEHIDEVQPRRWQALLQSDDQTLIRNTSHPGDDFWSDSEILRKRTVVTWDGENDPENPKNWPLWKRCFVTFLICVLTTSVYMGSSIYAVGIPNVMETFGVSQVAATLGLCLFVAGYGTGPMLWSSMSEVPLIGRLPVYLGTLAVFVALQIPTAKSSSFGMLLAFRFLTGFFGSPVLATGGATLADIWRPAKLAYSIALWGLAAVVGPTIGPLVSGFAVQYGPERAVFTAPWTWPIWELFWLSGLCLLIMFFFLPETSATNILLRRTKRLRKASGLNKRQLTCQPEVDMENMTGKEVAMMVLIRPFTLNFTEPMVLLLNLYIALLYGLLYIWFESFPIVFIEMYKFDISMSGLAYIGILIGMIIGTALYFVYLYFYLEPQFDHKGEIRPEARLTACFVGCWCIPICLFWFGWSARPDVHWIVPIIGSAWYAIGGSLLFNSILSYLPDAYPAYVASVMAGNDLMRSAFGASFPLFATAMYKNLGVGVASSVLGCISIAFIPIPFVLYKYGATIRENHSRHARKDI